MIDSLGHTRRFLSAVSSAVSGLSVEALDRLAGELAAVRAAGGRLFVVGSGGSAANASHAVGDFRKMCALESYAPSDNVAELTARTNDDGWSSAYADWLEVSRINERDGLLVLSVGGGDPTSGLSLNLVSAVDRARAAGARVFGVVGRRDGYVVRHAAVCVVVGTDGEFLTPVAESLQSVVCHLLATHPALLRNSPVWESYLSVVAAAA
ncbi:MAG TPA: SIS domain-containing protein [Micromonosporaceae bacterium]|nr:SIS domain-containing protein [Micromonosporaceae bacterium]